MIQKSLNRNRARHQRIFDVAVSDGREIDADGCCKMPVGDTVDVKNATYTNKIDDPVLGAYWQDPEFIPVNVRSTTYV